ncbi:MAG: LysR family transcriptional regulator [Candidatus Competibacteraceae bacterium]
MLINYSLYSMGELEASLGVERFRRVGRGLELTERCRCDPAGLRWMYCSCADRPTFD